MKFREQLKRDEALGESFRAAHRFEVTYDPKRVYTDAGNAYRNSPATLASVTATLQIDDLPFAIHITSESGWSSAHIWAHEGDDGECSRAAKLFGVAEDVLAFAIEPFLETIADELKAFRG